MSIPLYETSINSLPLVSRGKVRDIYAVGDDKLLIVTTDRLSAFDVVSHQPISGKGQVLNFMSKAWFFLLRDVISNHLTDIDPCSVVAADEIRQVIGRAVVVKRLTPLPIEAIVRGYIIGSGWTDYQKTGTICGIELPPGLQLADKLPEPIFTPSTKAEVGEHDENISFSQAQQLCNDRLASTLIGTGKTGADIALEACKKAIELYKAAIIYAGRRGIIIADTKLEFGIDEQGKLYLIDEAFTPDSSRFWPADSWVPGQNPESLDKQGLREYLQGTGWDKKSSPMPTLPPEIIADTERRYQGIFDKMNFRDLAV